MLEGTLSDNNNNNNNNNNNSNNNESFRLFHIVTTTYNLDAAADPRLVYVTDTAIPLLKIAENKITLSKRFMPIVAFALDLSLQSG